ncbi:MAG TPA: DUF3500 domain-containing protein [Chloroflexota bacterium]|jgi:hypothetical protein|nr:DUF3500 domain-containing protein [Chloroflexota bacterium]
MTTLLDRTQTARAPDTARRMANAARAFLDSLSPEQRQAATLPFSSERRFVWDYRPPEHTPRNGLRLVNMTREQQARAEAVLEIGLSARGLDTVRQIIALEPILRETERLENDVNPFMRDSEHYAFCVFGEPGGEQPWGWYVGGHHVALHITVVKGDLVSAVPLFFGANPVQVKHGPHTGLRTLAEEEDWARVLVRSLSAEQKQVAVFSPTAPRDILTDNARIAYPLMVPRGLAYGAMSGEQRGQLVRLVRHYVERAADELSASTWQRIEQAGLEGLRFAWAGPDEPGQGHYYAITGPIFLIEYDNTQDQANHIHSVFRDIEDDWGLDLLAQHYAEAHRA